MMTHFYQGHGRGGAAHFTPTDMELGEETFTGIGQRYGAGVEEEAKWKLIPDGDAR